MGAAFHRLRDQVGEFTMTTAERLFALHEALRYLSAAGIAGDFVEAGVWRGGSSMMAALTLAQLGDHRRVWLYDTFEGMPEPRADDVKWTGESAASELGEASKTAGARNTWAYATIDDVRMNMARTGYPTELVTYVKGKVEETIPNQAPDEIALLRLDTDWYESTKHELEQLWDRLVPGGVLIVDDYGHWQGARKAVDEFFAGRPQLLARVDYTGRMTVKMRG
jgi:O-methyltransferase